MQVPNLVQSKTSQNQIRLIEWNPAMDLLATVFCNDSLTCSRLLSLQKVWHKPVGEGTIESIAWRPDGRVLAIGGYNIKTKDYTCTLHDVENGHELNTIKFDKEITAVSWFQFTPNDDDNNTKDGTNGQKANKKPGGQIKEPGDTFSHQLAHNQTQLNVLLIATIDCKLNFYSLGLFHLGSFEACNPRSSLQTLDLSSKVVKAHASSCLRHITILVHNKIHNKGKEELGLRSMSLNTLHDRSKELLEISKMYARITDELEYLDDTMNAITTSWADVLAGLDNKLSSYCSRKSRRPNESQSGYTFISADELLQLLVIGYTSDNLEKFLSDMSDKGLKKLNNAIEQTCLRVQNLIVKNAQKCCYHLHGDINTLRELSKNPGYKWVGLRDKYLVDAMRSVGALMFKLTELQQVIDHTLKSSKSFFRWLISIACRMANEQNNSMVPNDINKTTQQDIQLITDFILDNFDYNLDELDELSAARDSSMDQAEARPTCSNFTLEQIGQYLKDEQLSRLKYSFAKRGSNFWIEFFKQKQELTETRVSDRDGSHVLTFYPHNESTSLIQEYKQTRQSIQSAFESFATSMSETLRCHKPDGGYPSLLEGDFSSRVKIEIDLRSGFEYTMFQQCKKGETIDTHYLIARQLNSPEEGTHSYLFGMRFVPLGAPKKPTISTRSSDVNNKSNQLEIADSNFYENKETKSILLTFLVIDKLANDTLIVQLDLKTVLDETRSDPEKKGRFWSRDAFKMMSEKYYAKSCRLFEFEIDLHSESGARKHSSGLMVKKIKRTVGQSMFLSSGRGVIAFTSQGFKRLHLYELESLPDGSEVPDDEPDCDERLQDESLIDTDLVV